ncbi:MAG: cation diffusion facilitator family transporter [Oscillospiraceae bacterium]|nr:cation diffusion facilitator family transporter [Oscillospiraceae bacterium]
MNNAKIAYRVSFVTIVGNVVLAVFKLLAGIIAASSAMVSDAVHSFSDVFSTIIVIIGVKISSRESDASHRYGHERMECMASMGLAAVLFATSIGIGYSGLTKIISSDYSSLATPGLLALIAAIVSIAIKELMYHYTMHAAKKINSSSLKADAWHHRSDALSSVASLIGIGGAMMGVKILDPIVSIIICLVIVKAAFDILKESIDKLVDKSCDDETVKKMEETVMSIDGVLDLDDIKTRLFSNKIFVDIEICADGDLTLWDAHEIAENVHDKIEEDFKDVKHCMVHVNPKMKND